jgi:hypothetical protein
VEKEAEIAALRAELEAMTDMVLRRDAEDLHPQRISQRKP